MTGTYEMRFLDGDDRGTTVIGEDQLGWPAPGIIAGTHPGGSYVKVDEQELPARNPGEDPIRYATYEWRREGKVG